jgi:polar amino acid transport system substrate-binding protein
MEMNRTFFSGVAGLALVFAALQGDVAVGGEAQAVSATDAVASLAPAGLLRAAINLGNGVLAQRDSASGELTGVSVVLANELGARLGVPVQFVTYLSAGTVFDAVDRDEWDIAFLAIEPERAEKVRFSQPYVYIDGTYLVRADSDFSGITDLDREGVTIAVGRGAAYDLFLTRNLQRATLLRLPTSAAAIAAFKDGDADAAAGVREALVDAATDDKQLKVFEDRFMQIGQGIAVPNTRTPVGAAYVELFVEEMKASGQVRAALDATGQAGAVVPAPAP